MTARVRSVTRAATSAGSGYMVAGSAGESTQVQPASSIHMRYSGKNGAITITSSPGSHTALIEASSAAAAPMVR